MSFDILATMVDETPLKDSIAALQLTQDFYDMRAKKPYRLLVKRLRLELAELQRAKAQVKSQGAATVQNNLRENRVEKQITQLLSMCRKLAGQAVRNKL